jgi:hypothetical protein
MQLKRVWYRVSAYGAALVSREITRQSQIIAFNNDFHMMAFIAVQPLLLTLPMRRTEAARR